MRAILLMLTIWPLFSGCAGITVPKTVDIPIAIACISAMPAPPDFYTTDALKAMVEGDFVLALASERKLRIAYEEQLVAVATPCLK